MSLNNEYVQRTITDYSGQGDIQADILSDTDQPPNPILPDRD